MSRFYDIEITTFTPDLHTSRTVVDTAEEAWAAARAAETIDDCVLLVGCHTQEVSYGDFYIWLAGDRASVRLDEHRDWYASDPAWVASAAPMDTWFRDADGPFPAQNAETISRAQAFEALEYWLQTGKMLPSLTWA